MATRIDKAFRLTTKEDEFIEFTIRYPRPEKPSDKIYLKEILTKKKVPEQ